MQDEIAELRKLLAESEGRAVEEKRRREEEERRREIAELDALQSRPKNLIDFLRSCHDFSINLQVVTDKTLTTQGDTTRPFGRLFPQRIVPWHEFAREQEKYWGKIAASAHFQNQRVYPSKHQLDYVQKYIDPINSELGLRHFARDTVENPVRTLLQEMHNDTKLRDQLQLDGTIMFESHTNLGNSSETTAEEAVEHAPIAGSHISDASLRPHTKGVKTNAQASIARGDSRAIKGSADQFCIYQQTSGQRVPVVLVEYKAPHKLPLNEIVAGLKGEIHPAQEIINKESNSAEFLSKSLLAAVITQLFSSMIGKGVQLGYVFTGEAIIFLNIPKDPSSVQYHLSIPHLDFHDDDENRYHRTSVAQITAFALAAVITPPPSQSWYDAAAGLDVWAVEYIDILKKIPETVRKAPFHSAYIPSRWKGFNRSPIRTRSRRVGTICNENADDHQDSSSNEGDGNEGPSTPTPFKRARRAQKQGKSAHAQLPRVTRSSVKNTNDEQFKRNSSSRLPLRDRSYCTHQCLLGLTLNGPLDRNCPNVVEHHGQHLLLDVFFFLLRTQLVKDRGTDADCQPLYVKGSRGALAKVRLSSHGYTFVAKAVQQRERRHLLHEANVYKRLASLQGSNIPVCLGLLDLGLPFYFDHGIHTSMLLLSWAGRPLIEYLHREKEESILHEVDDILRNVHRHWVLHKDVETRNWTWDGQRVMLIDFERAKILDRAPLQKLSPNRKRKRPQELKSIVKVDNFSCEIRTAKYWISRSIT